MLYSFFLWSEQWNWGHINIFLFTKSQWLTWHVPEVYFHPFSTLFLMLMKVYCMTKTDVWQDVCFGLLLTVTEQNPLCFAGTSKIPRPLKLWQNLYSCHLCRHQHYYRTVFSEVEWMVYLLLMLWKKSKQRFKCKRYLSLDFSTIFKLVKIIIRRKTSASVSFVKQCLIYWKENQ